MKHFCFFSIFAICFALSASAQSNYKPGYYISLQGDTTKGYVDYREWEENPEIIDFKPTLNNNQRQHLTPQNVRLVSITGFEIYKSHTGSVSADVPGGNDRDTSFEQKTVFLKLLTRGNKLALYEYRDGVKSRFFIAIDNAAPTELIYRSYQQNDRNIDERTYRKQLSVIASQNQKLSDDVNILIQRTDYKEGDLVKVINSINDKTDNAAITTYAQDSKAFSFYGGVAANITFYKTDGGLKAAGAPDATSVLPKILAGLNFYINPRIQKVVLRVEAGLALGRYAIGYTSKDSPYDEVVFKFNQVTLSVSPQVLFTVYNKPNFKFFMGGGLQASLSTYIGKEFRNADGTPSTLASQPFDSFTTVTPALVLKTGVLINKRVEINAGFLSVTDVTHDSYYHISTYGAQLGINYFFK
ncbi:hypothetical protein NAF17_09370 [Mucilaginibacter sp. RB4R14]|uniref:hypothetical protein n=1 Tax=Mucilaginibacter aurantiaciroseus TaxID=2949308 RepID=UPI00209150F4|nr:hypothetical protein [Mucilaginibacter aurantiaciroseus]MCO5935751.1 hypothetical protein [Mucilaginibacter aurantiaciroseus]